MTITEVRDVLRILAGIGDKIRKFEIEALFRILVAHTGTTIYTNVCKQH